MRACVSACVLELVSWLNSRSRFLIEPLIMSQLIMHYSVFFGTKIFFVMFTEDNHWTQFSASGIKFKIFRHFSRIYVTSVRLHRASIVMHFLQSSQPSFLFTLLLPHVSVLHVPSISSSLVLSPWWGVLYSSVDISVAVMFPDRDSWPKR